MSEETNEAIDQMSEEQAEEYVRSLVGATPQGDEKQNVHTFLANVATAENTTKVGNLDETEVGTPKLPQRTYLELALFCSDIANMDYFSNYLKKKAEILTSTSLSKNAKLISLAVVTRKEFGEVGRKKTVNKGWFGSNKKEVIET